MLDFMGIGAQKAGTSWLYEMLRHHPQLRFPAGKEIHFWDQQRALGIEWYQDLFSESTTSINQGEITPAYAFLDVATITEIKYLFPSLRLIFIVRNPIDRAWSSACMALGRAEMKLEEASDQWFIDHFNSTSSLSRGDYEACLRNWRAIFGVEQVLILRYEDINDNPRALLRVCCKHIGVDTTWVDSLAEDTLHAKVFEGGSAALRGSLLLPLAEIYNPKIVSLQEYLETDLSAWLVHTQSVRSQP